MKKGFFPEVEDKSKKRTRKTTTSSGKVRKRRGCPECGLEGKCETPRMEMGGKGEKGILIVAEAPGREEDLEGTQLVGKVGRYLERKMDSRGISLHNDCFKINAVNCRPPKNRDPTPLEIECCRPNVWKCIMEQEPKHILAFGQAAVESLIAHRYSRTKIGKIGTWRGWIIPDRDIGAYVFPMYHPSYAVRNRRQIEEKVFLRDLITALNFINSNPPRPKPLEITPEILMGESEIVERLEYLYDHPMRIAFDYETTGIKPYADGHEIVCCGIATSNSHGFAFPLGSKKVEAALKKVLRNRKIGKVCQNKKFEILWSKECLGVWPQNIIWDTMLMSHYLDNRPGVTGLKFQAYANFGVVGYDLEIEPYLKSGKKSANAFNRVREAPLDKLLEYCGMDAILTFRLFENQQWKYHRWLNAEEKR